MEAADLVVINTCAIREAAEAKVIGRQGVLRALKASNPGMRVVLTGCAVRERDRGGLARRFPAVDLFLRPDEEPELVERLGPRLGPGTGRARHRQPPRHHVVKGVSGLRGRPPRRIARSGRRRRARSAGTRPSRHGCRSSTAATRPAPTASSPSAAARSAAAPSTRSSPRPARWPRPGTARSRCSARTSTATATTCRPRRASPAPARSAGRAAGSTGAAGPTWPS